MREHSREHSRDVHPIIRQIIDRDCHVGEGNRTVIRHVISKLRDGYTTFRQMKDSDRREFIEQCLSAHRANIRLYAEVMGAFPLTKMRERELSAQIQNVSGEELVAMMKEHGKSIAYLAFRLGASVDEISQARKSGLDDPDTISRWLEALSDDEPAVIPDSLRVHSKAQSFDCNFCGTPVIPGDDAFEFSGEVFCSITCCRFSQGW